MNIHKTDIEWCSHTWNPVTGCRHDCKYCYARRIAVRFGPKIDEWPDAQIKAVGPRDENGNGICFEVERPTRLTTIEGTYRRSTPYPKHFAPTFHTYTLDYPAKRLTPARIFVCSMADLFGEWVTDEWIERVFDACRAAPQHTYMFLTKNPQRYAELANAGKLPTGDTFWYGTTVTHKGAPFFGEGIRYNTFLSIEPLMEDLEAGIGSFGGVRWIIVGAMTGTGSKAHQPKREWVENIVETARLTRAAVFMKNSLADIWGEPLIQKYPPEMQQRIEKEARSHEKGNQTPHDRRDSADAL